MLREIGDEDLAVAYVQLAAQPHRAGRDQALAALDRELARREGKARLTVDNDSGSRQVDELVRRGRSYVDAYAEVHGLDPAALDRQQRAALVDAARLPGERREQTLRRMYAEHVYLAYQAAEDATRGNVLSAAGRAKGIEPASLWSGPAARARKYASDELKAWWEAHGGRQTWAQYRAQYVGGAPARRRAEAARLAGSGRDYGL